MEGGGGISKHFWSTFGRIHLLRAKYLLDPRTFHAIPGSDPDQAKHSNKDPD